MALFMRSQEYVPDGMVDRLQLLVTYLLYELLCSENRGSIRDCETKLKQDGCLPGDWAFKICLDLPCPAGRYRGSLRVTGQVKICI